MNPIYRHKIELQTGYERLAYLESDGNQYIDTGIIADNTTGFYIDAQKTETENTDRIFMGSREGTNGRCWIELIKNNTRNNTVYLGWNGYTRGNFEVGNNRFNVSFNLNNSRKAYVNGIEDTTLTAQFANTLTTQTVPMFLWCYNNGGSASTKIIGRIYEVKITKGSTEVAHFVPCRRINDGVLGMYDTVSGTFKTNIGTGRFIAGEPTGDVLDEGVTSVQVYPVYKDDLAISYEKESGQQFFRRKLSGKIDFVGVDFDYIMQQRFEAVYYHVIEMSTDNGFTWSEYWRGKFTQTDCTINFDDKKISVQPDVMDKYNDVLDGLDKEYNLIELAPAVERVNITKRAALQVYLQNDSVLTYIVNGLSFESDCEQVDNIIQLQNNHFTTQGRLRELIMTLDGSFYNRYLAIVPFNIATVGTVSARFTCEDGLTYVDFSATQQGGTITSISYFLKRTSDNATLWYYTSTINLSDEMSFDMIPVSGSGTMHCDVSDRTIWTRILTDSDTFGDRNTYPLDSDDFSYDNRNYRRCIDYGLAVDNVVCSEAFSVEPTEWGRTNDGNYFVRPTETNVAFYPIGRSQWIYTSLWLRDTGTIRAVLRYGDKEAELQTNYPLWSVISVILARIAPDITFGGTSDYSQLLYGTTSFGLADTPLLMTPKSNVLAGEFSQPAQKATITLKYVLNMLKYLFQAYWYISEDGKFHVEHISFFKNGGSYSTAATVGIDLTMLQVVRNGKAWAFGKNEYSFEKEDMAERYQFEWMDDVSDVFVGKPIEIVSKYVELGKIENITISQFTTDVDYMLLAPENMSKDGFALFACTYSGGVYSIPIGVVRNYLYSPMVQNYLLTLIESQPIYWRSDLPAREVRIQGVYYAITGMMQRNRKQEVQIPTYDSDPDVLQLVKTGIGNGQIDKMSINLSSRMAKTTLRYDTEQEQ